MTDTLPITIDHLWGGVAEGWRKRAQRGDRRASDVLRAIGEALAEIAAGNSRCNREMLIIQAIKPDA